MYGKLFQHLVWAVGDKKKPCVLTAVLFVNTEVPGYSISFLHLSEGYCICSICNVQGFLFSSVSQLCLTLCDPMDWSMPAFSVLHQLLELAQTHIDQVGDAIPPSYPLLSPSPAFNFPSIRVFSNQSVLCIRWPKYWNFRFNISPSNEHPGLISFRMDWLDLIAVQGTLKSLLQHHSSKTSILQHSAFFIVQLSHAYMTTGKTIALTRRTFVGKIMSLLRNMLSRLAITFLPRSKRLNFMAAVTICSDICV